jgi:hypothetical protein
MIACMASQRGSQEYFPGVGAAAGLSLDTTGVKVKFKSIWHQGCHGGIAIVG